MAKDQYPKEARIIDEGVLRDIVGKLLALPPMPMDSIPRKRAKKARRPAQKRKR